MPKVEPGQWEDEQIPRHRSQTDARARHKDPRRCPVCSSPLERWDEGERVATSCRECRAELLPELLCRHCHTRRVWRGALGVFCHGCGQPQLE